MADRKLSLDEQLCFALYAATNAVTRSYRPRLDMLGLTYPQYLVMLVLWQDGVRSVREIARRLGLDGHAITPMVDRLEHAGLVERRRDDVDRRVVHVALTDRGVALERQVAEAQHEVVCDTQLEPGALDALREELMALVRRMEPERFAPPVSEGPVEPGKASHGTGGSGD